MVTVTTKTINYTITKGNRTNSVNATITSTPGMNGRAFKSKLVLLKILQLLMMIAAMILMLIHFRRTDIYHSRDGIFSAAVNNNRDQQVNRLLLQSDPRFTSPTQPGAMYVPYDPINYYWTAMIRGSIFYWGMIVTAIVTLVTFIIAYLASTTAWILVTRTTTLEIWYNAIMALCMLVASIIAFVHVLISGFDGDYYLLPLIASALGIATGILYIVGIMIARRDLKGTARSPHHNTHTTNP